jgi:UDP-glucuronate 4-epimerase
MDRPMEYEITNVIGTIRLLEFCRRMGVPHFVFASSSSVYGPDTPLPAEESTQANPCSPYALTKLHGTTLAKVSCEAEKVVGHG